MERVWFRLLCHHVAAPDRILGVRIRRTGAHSHTSSPHSASSATWSASAFLLLVSSFLLPFGRLADIYGGFPVYLAGCAWTAVWALVGGFSQNKLMLDFCRAIQWLGPAAYLSASLTLLGSMYRPDPRKNVVFSIYGSMAPPGFFIGIFLAGVAG
jgi:MFS family permease